MSPQIQIPRLLPDDLVLARLLWNGLLCPASYDELKAARLRLATAPASVQQALINEIAGAIREHRQPSLDENPFVSTT